MDNDADFLRQLQHLADRWTHIPIQLRRKRSKMDVMKPHIITNKQHSIMNKRIKYTMTKDGRDPAINMIPCDFTWTPDIRRWNHR